mmetsp:Transcript_38126/g.74503  ORF Transcript_38126/g.74503 Transcript_38126/m.74503 type:complete len:611 (-) Transcript_38126:179-2011(-)
MPAGKEQGRSEESIQSIPTSRLSSTLLPPPTTLQTLVRLLKAARPEAPRLIAACAAMTMTSLCNLAFPKIIGALIDHFSGLHHTPAASTRRFILGAISVFAVGAVGSWLRTYLFALSSDGVARRLRKALLVSIMKQDLAFFDQSRTSELISRLHDDVNATASATTGHVAKSYRYLNSAIGGSAMLLAISPRLTLVSLAIVPVMGCGAMAYGRHAKRLSKGLKEQVAAAVGVAEERIANIRTVRLFGQEEQEAQRFGDMLDEMTGLVNRAAHGEGLLMGGLAFSGFTALLAVQCYGGSLVRRKLLSVGSLTSFAMYSATVGLGFSGLSQLYGDVVKATASAQRVFELIDRVPEVDQSSGASLPTVTGHLTLDSVTFSYPGRQGALVLDALSLDIPSEGILALAGSSGSGKSTVAALLTRMYEPTSGRVLLDGVDVRTLSAKWLRSQMAVVNQDPLLFATTVWENVVYGRPTASKEEVLAAVRDAQAKEFIEGLPDQYQTFCGEKGQQLSGGQKQRIVIARAIIKHPKILILDEATNGLDGENERLVNAALSKMIKKQKCTTLIITHRLSVLQTAGQIAVLEGGRVVEKGSYQQLLTEDKGVFRCLTESLRA